jgi:hypothetical protein
MAAARKKRVTTSAAVEVGGCLWLVESSFDSRHVLAPDAATAMAVYAAIPAVADARAKDESETSVLEVRRLGTCVFALPIALDVDDDRSQS